MTQTQAPLDVSAELKTEYEVARATYYALFEAANTAGILAQTMGREAARACAQMSLAFTRWTASQQPDSGAYLTPQPRRGEIPMMRSVSRSGDSAGRATPPVAV